MRILIGAIIWCTFGIASLPAVLEEPLNPVIAPQTKALRDAFERMRDMEDRLLTLQQLLPADRYHEAQGLRRDLERLVDKVAGTRWENQAVFWLADWHFAYGEPDEVARLVSRLTSLGRVAYQAPGRALLARVLLRQGRIADARQLAEALVSYAPEFAPVLDMVRFHERIGQQAPKTSGRPLQGSENPLRDHSEPWFLYHFANVGDPRQRLLLSEQLTELRREEYKNIIRLVVVTFDGDPLGTLSHLASLENGSELNVLWANPNNDGDAEAWRGLWQLPQLPVSVLVGRDGTVMAIEPTPERLRPLVGLDPDDGNRGASAAWRSHRRGRYADDDDGIPDD